MSIDQLNLHQLKELEAYIPELAGFPSRVLVDTYEDFIGVLYADIDKIIYQTQENPELCQEDSEDKLTLDIKKQLCCMGYDATHELKIGGHCDLVVKKNNFIWIGEAKKHSSYPYLWKGFQQLMTRYSTGDDNQKDGGILIYIFIKNAQSVMQKWKNYLSEKELTGYSSNSCPLRKLAFFSNHTHERSGLAFKIRHMPVILYFNPKDKK
ncbi:MAG: hypothetical protein SWY16_19200 [Cyanobacteriota bacterium]|nr:hypothetical protein [Cyanobacteriota bacterium]